MRRIPCLLKFTVPILGTFFIFLISSQRLYSYFSKGAVLGGNHISVISKTYDLSSPQNAANAIGQMFLAKDYGSLYESFDAKLKQMLTQEEFIDTFDDSYYVTGFNILSAPQYTSSTQVYLEMRLTYNTGDAKVFDVIFNRNGSKWLLLGTVED